MNNDITLKDTVEMMLSNDYRERFKAEYCQLMIRIGELSRSMCNKDNLLNDCDDLDLSQSNYDVLDKQLNIMCDYAVVLRLRAEKENIELPRFNDLLIID